MSVVLDSREMVAVNFHNKISSSSSSSREMKIRKDDVMMRGISCFLGSGFHEKKTSTGSSCRSRSPGHANDLFCDYHHQRSDNAFGNIPVVALSREYNLIRGDHAGAAAAADQAGSFSRILNVESDSNSASSSIGAASSSSEQQQHLQDEEDGEEVQSERKSTALLTNFSSLEESLPLKRGLSNCFGGKSKSFGCLLEAVSLKDLVKSENPYNKRRRILLAYKNNGFGRSAAGRGFHSTINLTINSHVSVVEEEEDDDDDGDQHDQKQQKEEEEEEEEEESSSSDDGSDHASCIISSPPPPPPILHQYHPILSSCSYSQIGGGGGGGGGGIRKLKKKFTSPRSFSSLTDLHA